MAAADVREAADVADHLAELVRPFPGRRKGADAAGAVAADRASGRIVRQFHGVTLLNLGQDLLQQELHILTAERVVFETAVLAGLAALARRRHDAGIDEDPGHRGQFLRMDQVVEDHRNPERTLLVHHAAAVLKHHERQRRLSIIAGRRVDPDVADRSFEDPAGPLELLDFAARNAVLPHGIGAQLVIVRAERRNARATNQCAKNKKLLHGAGLCGFAGNCQSFVATSAPPPKNPSRE